jgi:hypothetical protein
MVSFQILSGKMAGTKWSTRHLPFSVGRSASAALRLDEPGVWDKHFEVSLQLPNSIVLQTSQNVSVTVSGKPTQETVLKNGDLIEFGGVKLRFDLTPTQQKRLTLRELSTWIGLGLLSLGQVVLIYWLSR